MKRLWMLLIALALAGGASRGWAQYIGSVAAVEGKEVIHNDNTKTDVIKDPLKHESTEITYDARKVVVCTKKYLLNDSGDPTQGQIFDGAGNLIARVQFAFDDLQRLSEERCMNLQGEIFRKVLHQYDSNGNPLPLKAMAYKTRAPNMQTATIDFTRKGRGAPATPAIQHARAARLGATDRKCLAHHGPVLCRRSLPTRRRAADSADAGPAGSGSQGRGRQKEKEEGRLLRPVQEKGQRRELISPTHRQPRAARIFATAFSAVRPCLARSTGTLPCSMNSSGQPMRTTVVFSPASCRCSMTPQPKPLCST